MTVTDNEHQNTPRTEMSPASALPLTIPEPMRHEEQLSQALKRRLCTSAYEQSA